MRCPLCLAELEFARNVEDGAPARAALGDSARAALDCRSCGATFGETHDGLTILVDLLREDPLGHEATGASERARSRAVPSDYGRIQTACRDALERTLEKESCSDQVRRGALYRRFVEWPVRACMNLLDEDRLRDARVLHIGPGMADESKLFEEFGCRFTGIDLGADYLRRTVAEVQAKSLAYDDFMIGAAESLPFADDSFDIVLIHKTLQWWFEPEVGLREAYRVGRSVLIVAEPASGSIRRLGQRMGWANRKSPITKRKINELSSDYLREVLPEGARIRTLSYLGKAIDSAEPRESVVRLDRSKLLSRAAVAAIAAGNVVLGRLGNQICAAIEKPR